MSKKKAILAMVFGGFMIIAGILHFLKPEFYFPFIPDFFPKAATNYFAGFCELLVGIGTFIPNLRKLAALGILLMMIAFLPLHVIDVFKEHPAIGNHTAALVRLPIQFLLIWWAWFVYKK